MKKHSISYAVHTPDWDTIPGIFINEANGGDDPHYYVEFKLAWNENRLFVHALSQEPYIRARYSGSATPVWQDSYIGLSIKPVEDDGRYFTFMSNSNGAPCCTLGTSATDKAQLLPMDEDETETFQIKTSRSESSWQIDFIFPLYFIKLAFPDYTFLSESSININCFKGGERTYFPHFLTWEPCPDPEKATPHDCNYFGTMTFEAPL